MTVVVFVVVRGRCCCCASCCCCCRRLDVVAAAAATSPAAIGALMAPRRTRVARGDSALEVPCYGLLGTHAQKTVVLTLRAPRRRSLSPPPRATTTRRRPVRAATQQSLYTLGKVIKGLASHAASAAGSGRGAPPQPVPYRDSKLTKLLISSLGGHCKTLMVGCVSASSDALPETLRTLDFAMRIRGIRNRPVVQLNPQEKLILELRNEVRDRPLPRPPTLIPTPTPTGRPPRPNAARAPSRSETKSGTPARAIERASERPTASDRTNEARRTIGRPPAAWRHRARGPGRRGTTLSSRRRPGLTFVRGHHSHRSSPRPSTPPPAAASIDGSSPVDSSFARRLLLFFPRFASRA